MCAAGGRAGVAGGRVDTGTQEGASGVDTWSGQDVHSQGLFSFSGITWPPCTVIRDISLLLIYRWEKCEFVRTTLFLNKKVRNDMTVLFLIPLHVFHTPYQVILRNKSILFII